jgi:hypothetical protein
MVLEVGKEYSIAWKDRDYNTKPYYNLIVVNAILSGSVKCTCLKSGKEVPLWIASYHWTELTELHKALL